MSAEQRATEVEHYVNERLISPDPALQSALSASAEAGLPPIAVTANEGKLLRLLASSIGAHNILEIGTLGAYSTIWLARALPGDGALITLEAEPRHAELAHDNLARAGLADRTEILLGDALDTLPGLRSRAPFDFTFIDADKPNTAEYFRWALELSRPGGLIVVDNVVRGGVVADNADDDPSVHGIQRLIELLRTEPRADATTIQTVGTKGYDGFLLARVT